MNFRCAPALFAFLLSFFGLQASVFAQSAASPAPSHTDSPTCPSIAEHADDASEKYNAYVESSNAMSSMFYGSTKGFRNLLSAFEKQRVESRSGGNGDVVLYLNTSMLRNSVNAMQSAVEGEHAGAYCELDRLGKRIYPNFRALLALGTQFESYVKSKKYQDDDFTSGREMGGKLVVLWRQVADDYERLIQALSQAERVGHIAAIAEMRKQGDLLGASVGESMLYSSDLIDVAVAAEGAKNTEQGAILVKQLDTAVATMRAQLQRADPAGREKSTLHRIGLIADYMDSILGAYRELKGSFFGGSSAKEKMIDNYNRAVRQFDRI